MSSFPHQINLRSSTVVEGDGSKRISNINEDLKEVQKSDTLQESEQKRQVWTTKEENAFFSNINHLKKGNLTEFFTFLTTVCLNR